MRKMTNVELSKHLRLYRAHMKRQGFEKQDAYELAGTKMRLIESRREDEVRPIKRARKQKARKPPWLGRIFDSID